MLLVDVPYIGIPLAVIGASLYALAASPSFVETASKPVLIGDDRSSSGNEAQPRRIAMLALADLLVLVAVVVSPVPSATLVAGFTVVLTPHARSRRMLHTPQKQDSAGDSDDNTHIIDWKTVASVLVGLTGIICAHVSAYMRVGTRATPVSTTTTATAFAISAVLLIACVWTRQILYRRRLKEQGHNSLALTPDSLLTARKEVWLDLLAAGVYGAWAITCAKLVLSGLVHWIYMAATPIGLLLQVVYIDRSIKTVTLTYTDVPTSGMLKTYANRDIFGRYYLVYNAIVLVLSLGLYDFGSKQGKQSSLWAMAAYTVGTVLCGLSILALTSYTGPEKDSQCYQPQPQPSSGAEEQPSEREPLLGERGFKSHHQRVPSSQAGADGLQVVPPKTKKTHAHSNSVIVPGVRQSRHGYSASLPVNLPSHTNPGFSATPTSPSPEQDAVLTEPHISFFKPYASDVPASPGGAGMRLLLGGVGLNSWWSVLNDDDSTVMWVCQGMFLSFIVYTWDLISQKSQSLE